jgi:hypothetical protein
MSTITDFVKDVANSVLQDILKKTTGTKKRVRRRKRVATAAAQPRTRTGRFKARPAKPAKRQTSRKRTVRTRSKARRRA